MEGILIKPVNIILMLLLAIMTLTGCNLIQYKKPDFKKYEATPPPEIKTSHVSTGSIYQGQASSFIFDDHKARMVGDIITVVLSESTDATKKATTATKKENTTDLGTPTIFGRPVTSGGANILNANIASSQEFTGEGDAAQSNALNGTIAVTVAKVYSNGNLFVKGQKKILLNHGEEYIQLSGIIRPIDIDRSNSIPSTLMADARIIYSGDGAVSESNKMGWLARFFNSQLWPL